MNAEIAPDGNAGYYIVRLRVTRSQRIRIGRLGIIEFESGIYCYVGRALKNLQQRIARHRKRHKPLRWHIDYLRSKSAWDGVEILSPDGPDECGITLELAGQPGAKRFPRGFGASDCGCEGHLVWFPLPGF